MEKSLFWQKFVRKMLRFQGVTVPRAVLRLKIFSFTFVICTLLGNLGGIEKREPPEIWTLSTKILFGGEGPSYWDGFQNCLQFYWVILKTEFEMGRFKNYEFYG